MEELVSRDKILEITGISISQFKSFRRMGLIEGHVKKISVVRQDKKKSARDGRQYFQPAGFRFLYPRCVLKQISWAIMQQEKGKTLREIQDERIRVRIEEEIQKQKVEGKYEKTVSLPQGNSGENSLGRKLVSVAIADLAETVKRENPHREIKTLVFIVETDLNGSKAPPFEKKVRIRMDVEASGL